MKTLKTILFISTVAAVMNISTASAQMSPYKFKQQFDIAFAKIVEGNYSEAIPVLEKLHKNDNEHGQVAFLLGMCEVKTNAVTEETVNVLRTASKYFDQFHQRGLVDDRTAPAKVWNYLAKALADQNETKEAITAYRNYMSCIPLASLDHKRDVMYAIRSLKNQLENPNGVMNSRSLAISAK